MNVSELDGASVQTKIEGSAQDIQSHNTEQVICTTVYVYSIFVNLISYNCQTAVILLYKRILIISYIYHFH